MRYVAILLVVILSACANPSEKDAWQGKWNAKWVTDRNAEGYENVPADYIFEMNGTFDFTNDEVTISAFGFGGCIFQSDSTVFTQSWELSGDTLQLQNQPGETGLTYQVLNQTGNEIRLQLVDDIFITLTK